MKLIAVDLDGTLLNSQHQISKENKQVLRRLANQGTVIVIATGRSVFSARETVKLLGVEAYVLALNGTFIAKIAKDGGMTQIRRNIIDNALLLRAFEISEEEGITSIASNEKYSDRVIFDEQQELVQEFLVERADLHLLSKAEIFVKLSDKDNEYLKAGFTSKDADKLQRLKDRLSEAHIDTIFSDQFYIEIVPEGINKGEALQFICDLLAIPLSEVLAFGDQENDIEMLQVSGVGVAMGNAAAKIKAIADDTTTTNDENGVAEYLEKHVDV